MAPGSSPALTLDPAVTCLYPEQLLKARWSRHHPLASAWDRPGLPSLYPSCPPHRTDALGVALAP